MSFMFLLLVLFYLIYFTNFNVQPVWNPCISKEYTEREVARIVKGDFKEKETLKNTDF